jgi:hypothetical protein
MKPKSRSGVALKTCPRVFPNASVERNPKTGKIIGRRDAICTHECHAMLDKMFEMSGMERVIQDNPEYHAPIRTWWMPSLEDRVESFIARHTDTVRHVESPAPDIVPPTIERTFTPTATGRSARGELESYVKKVCDIWLVEQDVDICSPSYLSEECRKLMGIGKPPSQGAINSVLERWKAIGFAVTAKKPTRFVKYTDEGIKLGLDAMKIQAKLRRGR